MRIISNPAEIEFAVQESRNESRIVHVATAQPSAVLAYLRDHYDVAENQENDGSDDIATVDWRVRIHRATGGEK